MFPLAVLLIPAGLFIAGILLYGALTTWALYRMGGSGSAYIATCIFWGGTVLILGMTMITLIEVDWMRPLLDTTAFSTPTF